MGDLAGRWWVYVLLCSDDTYYVGFTSDLAKRLAEHDLGIGASYTATRRPLKLLWRGAFNSELDARKFEHKVKRWGKIKKLMLIRGEIYEEYGSPSVPREH